MTQRQGKTVLIVDDCEITRFIAANHLHDRFGYGVLKASNGAQALNTLRWQRCPVDAILLDYRMPNMDGLAFFRKLRDSDYKRIPVVMMTGSESTDLAVAFMRMGGADFIQKPISDYSVVDMVIGQALERAAEKRRLKQEQTARLLAEGSRRMMEEFVAKLAHELGTPIHHIGSAVALMRRAAEKGDDKALKEWLDLAGGSTCRLRRLAEDVLDVSRIQRGKLSLRFSPFDLSDAANSAVSEVRQRFPALVDKLDVTCEPAKITGDRDRMTQVFVNLLNNMAVHAPGSDRYEFTLGRSGDSIRCHLSDQGPGIAPTTQKNLFEPFCQGAEAYQASGTLGLGLTICREIVQRHGGAIRIENNRPRGTKVLIDMPTQHGGLQ